MPNIEQRKPDFPLTRSPLQGVDVADTVAVRDWLLKMTELRIRHEGSLKPRFRYLTVDREEALDVGDPEVGDEPVHTMFFHQLGGRPEIRRRFRGRASRRGGRVPPARGRHPGACTRGGRRPLVARVAPDGRA